MKAKNLDDALAMLVREVKAAGVDLPPKEIRARIYGIAAAAKPSGRPVPLDVLSPKLEDSPLADKLRTAIAAIADGFARANEPGNRGPRLAALRKVLAKRKLDGFIVPLADEHQSEYVSWHAARLAWLTGFSGSAGLAIVLKSKAAIFVDGRYVLQVKKQVDPKLFTPIHIADQSPYDWLAKTISKGARLGYDPWLHPELQITQLARACAKRGAHLVAVERNPVDAVWQDQPPLPLGRILPHAANLAGESGAHKRARTAKTLKDRGVAAAFLSAPDSIAWLLNVRGSDAPHTPMPNSFATIDTAGAVDWYVDSRKLVDGTPSHLGSKVRVHPVSDLAQGLARFEGSAGVLIDPGHAPSWVVHRLEKSGVTVKRGDDPCALPKACKNEVEIAGTRAAHERDGVALTKFLAWLDREAPGGKIDELTAAQVLEDFRATAPEFRDLSFPTITGAGPNGAIVHYRATPKSNRRIEPGMLYLVDSGAQYTDGTTDVTRTIGIGKVAAEERDRFTRVLKGHIAIASCRFPTGTNGGQIDALARQFLWQAGLDYDHGTGHGVGSYLAVHEGPQRISKMGNTAALAPGMVISNEPGYYKTGAYGIRIENLVVVRPTNGVAGGERAMLGFETITLAPIDRRLIDVSLLTDAERAWLDAYHADVRKRLSPRLDKTTRRWLAEATAPIG
jgi:Xaa-Pro aminopeptidase